MNKNLTSNLIIATKVAAIYLFFSILWIVLSDMILESLFNDLDKFSHFQTYKGLFFITVSSLIIYVLVINELKKKNKLIKIIQSNLKYSDFLDGHFLDIVTLVFDTKRKILNSSGDLSLITHLGSDVLIGMDITEISADKDLLEFFDWNSQKALLDQEIRTEFHFNNKIFSFKGGAIRNENNEIIAGIFIIIDQTKHLNIIHQIESSSSEYQSLNEEFIAINEELKRSEEKYSLLASNISDVIWIADANYRISYISPSIYRFSGFLPEEIINTNLDKLITNKSLEEISKKRLSVEADIFDINNRNFTLQLQQYHKNGNILEIEVSMNIIFNQDGSINQVLGVTRDITERKKIENQLVEAKKKAEESDRLKSAFLTNISHEIRTPMNSIIGFSEILCDENTDAESRRKFGNIVKNSGLHLLDIINDILDISKLETDILIENKTWFPLNELIDELKDICENRISSLDKKIIITLDLFFDNGYDNFYGEKTRLYQVFNNLLINAIKFTKEGYINIGYSQLSGEKMMFWVKDTGIGIESEKQKIIFDRFRQVEENISRQYGGIGLGLSISKGLINWMEGEIWVESEPGKGSVFYFTIPILKENKSFLPTN